MSYTAMTAGIVEKFAIKQFSSCHYARSSMPFIPHSVYFCALYISTDIVRPDNNSKSLVPTVTQQIINCVFPISPAFANSAGNSISAHSLYSVQEHTLVLEVSLTHNKQQRQIIDPLHVNLGK